MINKNNNIEITVSLREVLQNGTTVSFTYITNRYEIVLNEREKINEGLENLLKETHGYMDRNKIGV